MLTIEKEELKKTVKEISIDLKKRNEIAYKECMHALATIDNIQSNELAIYLRENNQLLLPLIKALGYKSKVNTLSLNCIYLFLTNKIFNHTSINEIIDTINNNNHCFSTEDKMKVLQSVLYFMKEKDSFYGETMFLLFYTVFDYTTVKDIQIKTTAQAIAKHMVKIVLDRCNDPDNENQSLSSVYKEDAIKLLLLINHIIEQTIPQNLRMNHPTPMFGLELLEIFSKVPDMRDDISYIIKTKTSVILKTKILQVSIPEKQKIYSILLNLSPNVFDSIIYDIFKHIEENYSTLNPKDKACLLEYLIAIPDSVFNIIGLNLYKIIIQDIKADEDKKFKLAIHTRDYVFRMMGVPKTELPQYIQSQLMSTPVKTQIADNIFEFEPKVFPIQQIDFFSEMFVEYASSCFINTNNEEYFDAISQTFDKIIFYYSCVGYSKFRILKIYISHPSLVEKCSNLCYKIKSSMNISWSIVLPALLSNQLCTDAMVNVEYLPGELYSLVYALGAHPCQGFVNLDDIEFKANKNISIIEKIKEINKIREIKEKESSKSLYEDNINSIIKDDSIYNYVQDDYDKYYIPTLKKLFIKNFDIISQHAPLMDLFLRKCLVFNSYEAMGEIIQESFRNLESNFLNSEIEIIPLLYLLQTLEMNTCVETEDFKGEWVSSVLAKIIKMISDSEESWATIFKILQITMEDETLIHNNFILIRAITEDSLEFLTDEMIVRLAAMTAKVCQISSDMNISLSGLVILEDMSVYIGKRPHLWQSFMGSLITLLYCAISESAIKFIFRCVKDELGKENKNLNFMEKNIFTVLLDFMKNIKEHKSIKSQEEGFELMILIMESLNELLKKSDKFTTFSASYLLFIKEILIHENMPLEEKFKHTLAILCTDSLRSCLKYKNTLIQTYTNIIRSIPLDYKPAVYLSLLNLFNDLPFTVNDIKPILKLFTRFMKMSIEDSHGINEIQIKILEICDFVGKNMKDESLKWELELLYCEWIWIGDIELTNHLFCLIPKDISDCVERNNNKKDEVMDYGPHNELNDASLLTSRYKKDNTLKSSEIKKYIPIENRFPYSDIFCKIIMNISNILLSDKHFWLKGIECLKNIFLSVKKINDDQIFKCVIEISEKILPKDSNINFCEISSFYGYTSNNENGGWVKMRKEERILIEYLEVYDEIVKQLSYKASNDTSNKVINDLVRRGYLVIYNLTNIKDGSFRENLSFLAYSILFRESKNLITQELLIERIKKVLSGYVYEIRIYNSFLPKVKSEEVLMILNNLLEKKEKDLIEFVKIELIACLEAKNSEIITGIKKCMEILFSN
ncbi:hypothetical protein TCON_0290 [Astathelohania contejeani]|uniref:Mon2/Sec7/BIG1-like dimerisation and cyclophilin-binding domain-containing protein n=1 Tax=Astathelohania contejeani TaxID=164912 RepID=A0ABQ7I278_9MICR|nr:hypothetical protein TCON_0290 [Thelohania contejeani]